MKKVLNVFLCLIIILAGISFSSVFFKKFLKASGETLSSDSDEQSSDSSIETSSDDEKKEDEEEVFNLINGKKVSFLGDSITTFEGWNNNTSYNSTIGNNAVWYNSDMIALSDTYWKKTIDDFELNLICNNSWSASLCSGSDESSACNTRATQLHNNAGENPDIIVIYIGTNDSCWKVSTGTYSSVSDIYNSATQTYVGDTSCFSQAYATMVHKIKQKYDKADIYVCNLLPNCYISAGTLLSQYNAYISQIAKEFDCKLVDFYNDSGINQSNYTNYTFEGLHPNESGHLLMAKCLQTKILESYELK